MARRAWAAVRAALEAMCRRRGRLALQTQTHPYQLLIFCSEAAESDSRSLRLVVLHVNVLEVLDERLRRAGDGYPFPPFVIRMQGQGILLR